MIPLLVSVSTNEKSFNTTRTDWFYSDANGLKRDNYKSSIGYSNIYNEWDNTSQATIKDDGKPVGSFVSVENELSINRGAFISDSGYQTSSVSTYSATFTPSFSLFPGVALRGSVKLLVSATFDVEAGTPMNLVCALKPTDAWALRWTGIPQLDRIIFSSGREVWSFVQESVFDCPKAVDTLFDVSYDIKMEFNDNFKDTWRFGIKAIHNLVSSSWNNIILKPILPALAQIPLIRAKRAITPTAPLVDEEPLLEPIEHKPLTRKKRDATSTQPFPLKPSAPELIHVDLPALTNEIPTNDDETAVELMVKRNRPRRSLLFKCFFNRKQKP